jgi:hypothetical protein
MNKDDNEEIEVGMEVKSNGNFEKILSQHYNIGVFLNVIIRLLVHT